MNLSIVNKWFSDNGDLTHRLNYNINSESIVFDLGGYQGLWTKQIFDRYNCNVYVFEPVPHFADSIQEMFKIHDKIKVFNYGLSDETKELDIFINGDSTSFNIESKNKVRCKVRSIVDFLNESNIHEIDLMKINIEGDEFPLLQKLIQHGLVTMVKNIQVQFHSFVPNSYELRKQIQEKLAKTHKITYNYEFVWENWERI